MNKFYLLLSLSFVFIATSCGNQSLEGEYKNTGEGCSSKFYCGVYDTVEFRGKNTAVIKGMGVVFATSYLRDGQLITLKGDASDLLFTVKDDKTLVSEGFAEGIYKKY